MICFLETEEVLQLHTHLIEKYGGAHGVRDLALLQSAVAMPKAGWGSDYVHKDLYEMAAAYLYHLALNHPFIDGNKRIAIASALLFLSINETELMASIDELEELTMDTATGDMTKVRIAEFFREHSA